MHLGHEQFAERRSIVQPAAEFERLEACVDRKLVQQGSDRRLTRGLAGLAGAAIHAALQVDCNGLPA